MMGPSQLRKKWWEEPSSSVYECVADAVRFLDEEQDYRRERYLHNLRLYDSVEILGLEGGDYARHDGDRGRVRINVIQSVVDSALAQIGTLRPKATYTTFDGDFGLQQRARKLNKFTQGAFDMVGQYEISEEVFVDAALHGTGIEKVFEQDGNVCVERVPPNELLVDDAEARYGHPHQIFQIKEVSREAAVAMFGEENREAVLKAKRIRKKEAIGSSLIDNISVMEAWHLPSKKGAKDGRHVICLDTATLFDEVWEEDSFPFSIMRWQKRSLGFWGRGLAELLGGIQMELDFIQERMQRIISLNVPHMIMAPGSKVSKAKISNEEMTIIEGDPGSIQPLVFNAVPPEYYEQQDRLYQRAFEIAGISQLAATSQKTPGLNSGKALRTFNDIQSRRFLHVQRGFERFHVDVAKQMVGLARKIDERGDGSIKIMAKDKDHLEYISWSDVKMGEDQYSIQAFPTSFLDVVPGARYETALELLEALPELRVHALRLLKDHPDIEAITDAESAPYDLLDQILEKMLDKGEAVQPEPGMDLQFAVRYFNNQYLKYKMRGAPEENLQLILTFIENAQRLIEQSQQPQQAAPQAAAPQAQLPVAPGGEGQVALPTAQLPLPPT